MVNVIRQRGRPWHAAWHKINGITHNTSLPRKDDTSHGQRSAGHSHTSAVSWKGRWRMLQAVAVEEGKDVIIPATSRGGRGR